MRFGIVGRVGDDMIEKRHWADNLKAIAEIQRRVPDVFDSSHAKITTSPTTTQNAITAMSAQPAGVRCLTGASDTGT